jgi:hypothetical protein
VPVLVEDHLGVLGVVDSALAETKHVVLVPGVRVVDAELVDADVLRFLVDRPPRDTEAETLDVALSLGDPVIGHYLLEPVVVPLVEERVRG